MKSFVFVFLCLVSSLSDADVPTPIHLSCRGNGLALEADALANVINSNRLTNVRVQVGTQRAAYAQIDGRLNQGHIWLYVYDFSGVELSVQYNFAQTMNTPLMAYFRTPSHKDFLDVNCRVTGH